MKNILIFLILLFSVDRGLGSILDRISANTKMGEGLGLVNFALDQSPQILILGSSRAKHHLDPNIIAAKTSMTVFNGGINGQEFLYAIMFFDLWRKSHPAPKAILLNVDPNFFQWSEWEHANTIIFSPFIHKDAEVDKILMERSKFESLKYAFQVYRYNGKILPMLKNAWRKPPPGFCGFIPLEGNLAESDVFRTRSAPPDPFFSKEKMQYFDELCIYCKSHDTVLFLVHGPRLLPGNGGDPEWVAGVEKLVANHPGVKFINISEQTYPEPFATNHRLYADMDHLNGQGAKLYSTMVANQVKQYLAFVKQEGQAPPQAQAPTSITGPSQ